MAKRIMMSNVRPVLLHPRRRTTGRFSICRGLEPVAGEQLWAMDIFANICYVVEQAPLPLDLNSA